MAQWPKFPDPSATERGGIDFEISTETMIAREFGGFITGGDFGMIARETGG